MISTRDLAQAAVDEGLRFRSRSISASDTMIAVYDARDIYIGTISGALEIGRCNQHDREILLRVVARLRIQDTP